MNLNDLTTALVDPKTVAEMIIVFGATLAGAFIGFGLAILSDRRNRKGEITEKKVHMLNSLIQELKDLQTGLNDPIKPIQIKWNSTDLQFEGNYSLASIPAFESSVNSGNFILLPTRLQAEISQTYLNIEHYNWHIEQVLRFRGANYFSPAFLTRDANTIADKVHEFLDKMRTEINHLLPKLESAKNLLI